MIFGRLHGDGDDGVARSRIFSFGFYKNKNKINGFAFDTPRLGRKRERNVERLAVNTTRRRFKTREIRRRGARHVTHRG